MEFIKPSTSRLEPGKEVDTYCSRCKLELTHVIVAMNGTKIARVQCRTCHNVHAYREKASAGPRRKTKTTATRKSRTDSLTPNEYNRLMEGRDGSRAVLYKPSERFGTNDLLQHPKFGLGAVTRVLADDKIEVGFASGLKVLVHGR